MKRVSVKATKSISQARHVRVVNVHATVKGRTTCAAKAVLKKK